jgi:hypothetical protein
LVLVVLVVLIGQTKVVEPMARLAEQVLSMMVLELSGMLLVGVTGQRVPRVVARVEVAEAEARQK